MPLGKTPAERYALRLRGACAKLGKDEPSLARVGSVERSRISGWALDVAKCARCFEWLTEIEWLTGEHAVLPHSFHEPHP